MILPVWCDIIYRNKSNQTFYGLFGFFFLISASGHWSGDPAEAHQTAVAATCLPFLSLHKEVEYVLFVTLYRRITARWPHICGKKFPQTSICTSPKAQSGGKTGVFSISAIQQMYTCLRVRRGYLQIQAPQRESWVPPKRLTSPRCRQSLRPTMTVLTGCDIVLWEKNISKVQGFICFCCWSKFTTVATFGVNADTSATLQDVVEKLTKKPHGGGNHLVHCSLLFTLFPLYRYHPKWKDETHTRFQPWTLWMFSTFRMNCSMF